MRTVTLLASAPTLERITKLVNKFFYSNSIELREDSAGVYSLINSKGKIDGCRVIKKKNRFRFEMVQTENKKIKNYEINRIKRQKRT